MCRTAFILLFLGCWLSASSLSAAFILDDFDDPVEIISPEMMDLSIDTFDVGPLDAKRSARIGGSQGNPDGFLDANITTPSTLTAQVTNLNPVPMGSTRVSIVVSYEFAATDFTESGANNALFFDFRSLTSEMPPSMFLISVGDAEARYFYFYTPTHSLLGDSAFTVIVPFSNFSYRDGQPGLPNYTTIESMRFELRASQIAGGGPDPLNFTMQLDRIRVGRIPEPTSLVMLCWGMLLLALRKTEQ